MSVTLLEALNSGAKFLKEKGIGNPRSSAELLLCSILNSNRVGLYLNKDEILKQEDKKTFDRFLEERGSGKPIQYITGSTEFLDLEFKVDSRALIPRPETEILTLSVIDHFKDARREKESLKMVDLGTGSGAIGIALAKNLKNSRVYATDISKEALELAAENAKRHKVEDRIELVLGDLFEPLENRNLQNSVDCVVSNPPYVKGDDFNTLDKEIRDFEPQVALFSGEDGLKFHRAIVRESKSYLRSGGLLALEAGWEDGEQLFQFVKTEGLYHNIQIVKDLAGIKRIVEALKR